MCKMSQPDSSSKSLKLSGDLCERENTTMTGDDSDDKTSRVESNNPERCLREKVLKEVGFTSSAFIGPAFPPQTVPPKPDIEDSLSLFYKELEKIDTPDTPDKEEVQPNHNPPELFTSKHCQDAPDGKVASMGSSTEKNFYQSNSGPTRPSWAHRYQNEPYQVKRQRPEGKQWDYTLPSNEPPYPKFNRPPFPHQSHQSTFSSLQSTPAHIEVNPNGSGMTNQHHKDLHSPLFSGPRTPNVFNPPPHKCYHENPQGYHENPQRYHENPQGYHENPKGYHENPQRYHENPQRYHENPQRYHENPQGYHENPQDYHENPQGYHENPQRYHENPQGYHDNPQGYHENPKGYHENPKGYHENPKGYQENPQGYHENPQGYHENPKGYHENPEGYQENPQGYHENPQGYHENPKGYHENPEGYQENPQGYHKNPQGYHDNPQGYHENPNGYHENPKGNHKNPQGYHDNPQGYHENPPQHFGCNEQSFYDSSNEPVRWSEDRREERQRCDEDYDRPPRFMSGNKAREQQHGYRPYEERREYRSGLVLILLRGLPGSGKTTLARELLSTGPSGIILSTDDYFAEQAGYRYDPGLLGAAHEWNQRRAKDALHDGRSPIIIDNTNLQAWEMKPYVKMALERGYKVDFCEPDTNWKFDRYELEKRNKHGVPQEKIAQMMDRFSFPISIDIVLNSQEPAHVNQRRRPEPPQIRNKMHFS